MENYKIHELREKDFDDYFRIVRNAYPGLAIKDQEKFVSYLKNTTRNNLSTHFYGCFHHNKLRGGMRLHDFNLNLNYHLVNAGGIGFIAVDMLHKKEKVCKAIMDFFHQHYLAQKIPFLVLYAFRPDFYADMGFGMATTMHKYVIEPRAFPRSTSKSHLVFADSSDLEKILEYHNAQAKRTHGMILRQESDFKMFFNNPEYNIVAFQDKNRYRGYLIFKFNKVHQNNFVINDMEIYELLYDEAPVLNEFCFFMNSQSDQINRIILYSQDEYLHFKLNDIRNNTGNLYPPVFHESYSSGLGMMFKITDLHEYFAMISPAVDKSLSGTFKFTISDSFIGQYNRSLVIKFKNGKAFISSKNQFDTELKTDISYFSSIAIGALTVVKAWELGLIEISDTNYITGLQKIFPAAKPQCTIWF
ncbi:MAG: GNAT family N-acetyltransferase [Candidatus Cloacimonetes bacterium]|nr:GNAT family N-acetyltransferase [Candidatus Cloacimonadota bacterium]